MKNIFISAILAATAVRGDYSYSSSSFESSSSSIVTDADGKVHSSAKAEEAYSEKDSRGLNRSGKGKYLEKEGKKVYESTKTCEGDECVIKEQKPATKNMGVPLSKNEIEGFQKLLPLL
jgi:hypothetical protein